MSFSISLFFAIFFLSLRIVWKKILETGKFQKRHGSIWSASLLWFPSLQLFFRHRLDKLFQNLDKLSRLFGIPDHSSFPSLQNMSAKTNTHYCHSFRMNVYIHESTHTEAFYIDWNPLHRRERKWTATVTIWPARERIPNLLPMRNSQNSRRQKSVKRV